MSGPSWRRVSGSESAEDMGRAWCVASGHHFASARWDGSSLVVEVIAGGQIKTATIPGVRTKDPEPEPEGFPECHCVTCKHRANCGGGAGGGDDTLYVFHSRYD